MSKVVLQCLSMAVVLETLLIAASNVMVQESTAEEPASGQAPASDKRKTEFYAGCSILGADAYQ